MRLLWFNLTTDLDDPVLGFTASWIHEIAKLVRSIRVITMRKGRVNLPKNVKVTSVGTVHRRDYMWHLEPPRVSWRLWLRT